MVGKVNRRDKKFQKAKSYLLPLTSYFLLKKGQTILEYTIVLGVIIIVMFSMGPMIKRGLQSLIKVVADQVGVQNDADQRFDEAGHMVASYVDTRGSMDKQTQDIAGRTRYIYDDFTTTSSNALVNLGFTEDQ
jgi:predicted PurR-regulated permease PerM